MKRIEFTLYGDILGNEAEQADYEALAKFIEETPVDGVTVEVDKQLRTIGATPNPISAVEGMSEDEAKDHVDNLIDLWLDSELGALDKQVKDLFLQYAEDKITWGELRVKMDPMARAPEPIYWASNTRARERAFHPIAVDVLNYAEFLGFKMDFPYSTGTWDGNWARTVKTLDAEAEMAAGFERAKEFIRKHARVRPEG